MAALSAIVGMFSELFNSKNFKKNSFLRYNVLFRKRKHDDEVIAGMASSVVVQPRKKAKIQNYYEEIIPRYSNLDFKGHFRLQHESVEYLCQILNLKETKKIGRSSIIEVKKEKVVLLSLWILGNQESFRGVGDRFGLDKGHAHRLFIVFCKGVCNLKEIFIKWPVDKDAQEVVKNFSSLRGRNSFPNVFGCVDGTLIQVTVCHHEKQEYYSRKQCTAVILQGICRSDKMFTAVYAGWPGSAHDARVWRNSDVGIGLSNKTLPLPENCHLLGDSAYPLETYLMVPYKDNGHLNSKQKYFNKRLSSSRIVIEQAYGDLFGRFRRLKFLFVRNKQYLTKIILTACVLHNLCILQSDVSPDEDKHFTPFQPHPSQHSTNAANNKRDAIADYLYGVMRLQNSSIGDNSQESDNLV
ncbi:protein ALP1-like [Centruroides sculpturatus]|uniref:protein ALP1-like n=1 Tax=Centruroides sculpturatus TaxID=218467 RepID=UPI000C6E43C8|nr:protein ALP1-like [Centruroides sculpturatus]